jgi:hypothetical protein
MSLPTNQSHIHPLHRSKTSASDPSARETREPHNAWEDSTVASMFGGESEGRPAASDRLRVHHQGSHSRHYSDIPPPNKALPAPPPVRSLSQRRDENLPFVFSQDGVLRVLPPLNLQKAPESAIPNPAAANSVSARDLDDQSVQTEDVYSAEPRQPFETPTKSSALRRTRLAYREGGREPKRNPSKERGGGLFSPVPTQLPASLLPDRQSEVASHLEQLRLQERAAREKEREREREREKEKERERELARERQRAVERELENKRSTEFENLDSIGPDDMDLDFNNTKAAVVETTIKLDPDVLSESTLERTPRAHQDRSAVPRPLLFSPTKLKLPEVPVQVPLARTNSGRRTQDAAKCDSQTLGAALVTTALSTAPARKRRYSLDYNDAELNAMSYTDLRDQDFDFDPQTAVLQQQPPPQLMPPQGGTLAERLEHYKTKGSMDQHEFLAHLPLDEWDEAGDWFLEQFSSVVRRIREARRARRKLVREFEDEVAARAEAVRLKTEAIERTLEELKAEGQTMMEGKDVDVDF